MDQIKINSQTGQVAVQRGDGWHIYEKGQYKVNSQTGQIAIPSGDGWEIHEGPQQAPATPAPVDPMQQGFEQFAGPMGSGGSPTASTGEAFLQGGMQGASGGFSDEMGAAGAAMIAAQKSGRPFKDVYAEMVQGLRGQQQVAQEAHPAAYIGGAIAGSIPSSLALPGKTLAQAVGSGAVVGGVNAAGASNAPDLQSMVKPAAIGAVGGGVLGGVGYGINKMISSNTPSGIAYTQIDNSSKSGIDDLVASTGNKPAAAVDPVYADILKSNAAGNPKAAVEAIPAARAQVIQANQAAADAVDKYISPENATMLLKRVKEAASKAASQGYEGGAYQNPALVSLVKEISDNPAVKDAMPAVLKLAEAQARENPTAAGFSVRDLDALQRALKTMASKSFESTPENTLMGPVYKKFGNEVNDLATKIEPQLAENQKQWSIFAKQKDAVDLAKTWLNPGREAVEVGDEFASLIPEAQDAARAQVASKLRAALASKKLTANAAAILEQPGLSAKLEAFGFPKNAIDQIVEGGAGARRVLDALTGGSDTARKLMAASASKSPLSQFQTGDIVAAGVLNNPAIAAALPTMRAAGGAIDRGAAGIVIKALTDPNELVKLSKTAPQAYRQLMLGLLRAASAGASAGVQQ